MKIGTLCRGLALLGAWTTLACAAAAPAPQVAPRHWALNGDKVFLNNMPSTETSGIWSIAQDRQGFLWLGTDSGLTRWDGYRLQNYMQDPGTPGSLPDNFIRNLLVDDRGQLWVGTNAGGLNRYDPLHDSFVSIPVGQGGTRDASVDALISDGAGGLWIGTGKGLDHLDGDSGRVDPPLETLPSASISALLLDRHKTLWVGTTTGLLRRAKGEERFTPAPWPAHEGALPGVTFLLEDSAGRVWIGTALHGAFVLEPGAAVPRQVVESGAAGPMTDTITVMREVGAGEVWLGTEINGIMRVDTASWKTWREHHDETSTSSLPSDEVHALFLDRSGLVWIGSSTVLSRNDPQQRLIQTFYGGSGADRLLSKPSVPAVLAFPDGRVWAGLSDGSIDIIDPTQGRIGLIRSEPGMPEHALARSRITSMTRADDGHVFVGSASGLYRVDADGHGIVRMKPPIDRGSVEVRRVLYTAGRLWIGTIDGLWELSVAAGGDLQLLRHYEKELGDPRVTFISSDSASTLWVGTMSGLARLDLATRTVSRLPVDPNDRTALPGGYVSSVLTDRAGHLWVATFGRGIQVEQGRTADGRPVFLRLTQRSGLPQNGVDEMLLDAKGNVWVSTDDGLARVEPESLRVHSYRAGQGVGFAGFWASAGAATPAGDLIFGGLSGIVVLHPESMPHEAQAPGVTITEAHVGNQPVAAAAALSPRGLDVAAQERSLEIEFAALDFADPEHRRYAYRLQGFDADWVETPPTRRLASYTNLPPGDYTLQLRSASPDGQWSEPLNVPVHVRAAWHQHAAVRGLGILLLLGLVIGLVQLRTLFLRKRQVELERLIAERTAELRRSQEQLEQMAYFDSLTGLPNRRMFSEQLRRLIAARARGQGGFALLLIDLDGFKPINDTYGHVVGDALLVAIAGHLRTLVRDTDLAARLGGDEFAVLLSQTTEPSALESTCARIVTKLSEPLIVAGRSLKVGASIGIVPCPHEGITADELYRAADSALYQAKQAGRNTWRWGKADAYTFDA
jgi:diguanylate cyclase (GGDEF)-like protein